MEVSGACFACTIRNPKLTSQSDGGGAVGCQKQDELDGERERESEIEDEGSSTSMPPL